MLVAVTLNSTLPLILALGGASENPFLVNLALKVGFILGALTLLWVFHRRWLLDPKTWSLAKSGVLSVPIFLLALSVFDHVLFALSIRLIDVSVATVLRATSPVFHVVMMAWLFRVDDRYRKVTPGLLALLGMCLLGGVLVIASQVESTTSAGAAVGSFRFMFLSARGHPGWMLLGLAIPLAAVALLGTRYGGRQLAMLPLRRLCDPAQWVARRARLAAAATSNQAGRLSWTCRLAAFYLGVVGVTLASYFGLGWLVGLAENSAASWGADSRRRNGTRYGRPDRNDALQREVGSRSE